MADGFEAAWSEVHRLIQARAKHRSGFRLGGVSQVFIAQYAVGEAIELQRAVKYWNAGLAGTDRAVSEELADLMGVLFHLGIVMGYTPETLTRTMLAKFKERFTEQGDG